MFDSFSAGKVGMPISSEPLKSKPIEIPEGRDPLKMGHSGASMAPPTEREMSLTALTILVRNTRVKESNEADVVGLSRRGIERCLAAGNQSFMIYQAMVKGGLDMAFDQFARLSRIGGQAPSPAPTQTNTDEPKATINKGSPCDSSRKAEEPTAQAQENTEMTKTSKELTIEDVRAHLQKCIDAGEKPSFDLFRRSGIAHLLNSGVTRHDILRGITDQVVPAIPGKVANGILTSVVRYCGQNKPQEPEATETVVETITPVEEPTPESPELVEAAEQPATTADQRVSNVITPPAEFTRPVEADTQTHDESVLVALTHEQHMDAHQDHFAVIDELIGKNLQDLSAAEYMISLAKDKTLQLAESIKADANVLMEAINAAKHPVSANDDRVVLLKSFAQSEFTDPRIREALSSLLADVVAA